MKKKRKVLQRKQIYLLHVEMYLVHKKRKEEIENSKKKILAEADKFFKKILMQKNHIIIIFSFLYFLYL
jgi:hypothetical protein